MGELAITYRDSSGRVSYLFTDELPRLDGTLAGIDRFEREVDRMEWNAIEARGLNHMSSRDADG